MALTILDRTAALIVIDLQKGLLGTPTLHPLREVMQRSAALAAMFRKRSLPVVLVNVAGASPGRTDIGCASSRRPRISKNSSRNSINSRTTFSSPKRGSKRS